MIFISSVGSKWPIIFYNKITGINEITEIIIENKNNPILN